MSTLKYAMTMDGKIATPTGHAAWVSNTQSRQRVFAQRALADAVIVGGNTVRRDNPRLTTRRDGGHSPIRVVMSRTLDLSEVRSSLALQPFHRHVCVDRRFYLLVIDRTFHVVLP
jgi:diaminohydroxyphosphoribosylaminopyrimidine deaminase / 5-amino-6-(5-phosphoribosylamino)uracil reductase